MTSDTEGSELSDSSTERGDPPKALDEAEDETAPINLDKEGKPSVEFIKKSKKKGRKGKGAKVLALPL